MTMTAVGQATRPLTVVLRSAAALAAAMGVGRFVYTPILPLMHAQAGMSAELGATLATANYAGYLIGALAGAIWPTIVGSRTILRSCLVVIVVTLALMPVTRDAAVWFTLRLVTGVASAVAFVITVDAALARLRAHGNHLTGWVFGGVGSGIALSGVLVLALRFVADWQVAWWSSAGLAAVLAAVAWSLETGSGAPADAEPVRAKGTGPWFAALFTCYSLEGVGYVIAGTFLVAGIDQTGPAWLGSGAWVLVGLAAAPSTALWTWLAHRWSRPVLLLVALILQAVSIALPVLVGGVPAALVAALLFGGTLIAIAALVLAVGAHLRVPRAVALLTSGYSVGQMLGPLVVTPLLRNGYHEALLVSAGIVVLAVLSAAALRVRFPHVVT
jgi:MFS family permease